MLDHKYYDFIASAAKARGKSELLKHLDGGKLTLKQAILAKCYDCMGYYIDGKVDCGVLRCPLYPFMYYNPNKIKPRELSEKQKENMDKNPFFTHRGASAEAKSIIKNKTDIKGGTNEKGL